MLFQRLIWAALVAALALGSLQTGVQRLQTVPIILAAEVYEGQKVQGFEPALASAAPEVDAHAHAQEHSHEAGQSNTEVWSPENGLERTFWTWVANVIHAFGMALLVLAVMGAAQWRSPQQRVAWLAVAVAAAGWLTFDLWPSLGLPAEIPGMDAARLGSRQSWWALAAGSAALACVSLGFLRHPVRWAAAVAWLAVPLVLGAPHITADPLAGFSAGAQAELRDLGQQFIWATAWVSLSFWTGMGVLSAFLFSRWVRPVLVDLQSRSAASNATAMKVAK